MRFRNLIASRKVLLGDLLGVADRHKFRLIHGRYWDLPMWLIVAGKDSVLAQVGLPAELLPALGIGPGLSLPLLSAAATQMLSPLLPSLRQLFDQDVSVRVENAEGGWPDTDHWLKFVLISPTVNEVFACRVHEAFSQKLVDRACAIAIPRSGPDLTRVPLFLGAQQRLTLSRLRGLQVGDVIVVEDAEPGRLDLRIDSSTQLATSPRLAVVNDHEGRVEHLSPGSWHELHRRSPREGGAAVAVDIVVARVALRAYQCRQLALGQCVPEWGSVAWLDEAELRACGRILGTARAVVVGGCRGYEVVRLSL
jgi:hypothetical protein